MTGAGKTTIGKLLAENINKDFEDLDETVERKYALSIKDIFSKYGEVRFREAESDALMNSSGDIISCGGGIILNKKNRDYIKRGLSFFLNVDLAELEKRLRYQKNRPLLNNANLRETLASLWEKRENVYLQTADHIINVKDESPNEIMKKIKGYINE